MGVVILTNKKQYIIEKGTHYYAKSDKGYYSGPLSEQVVFEENDLVRSDISFMVFKRGTTNYTFHPSKVKVVGLAL